MNCLLCGSQVFIAGIDWNAAPSQCPEIMSYLVLQFAVSARESFNILGSLLILFQNDIFKNHHPIGNREGTLNGGVGRRIRDKIRIPATPKNKP